MASRRNGRGWADTLQGCRRSTRHPANVETLPLPARVGGGDGVARGGGRSRRRREARFRTALPRPHPARSIARHHPAGGRRLGRLRNSCAERDARTAAPERARPGRRHPRLRARCPRLAAGSDRRQPRSPGPRHPRAHGFNDRLDLGATDAGSGRIRCRRRHPRLGRRRLARRPRRRSRRPLRGLREFPAVRLRRLRPRHARGGDHLRQRLRLERRAARHRARRVARRAESARRVRPGLHQQRDRGDRLRDREQGHVPHPRDEPVGRRGGLRVVQQRSADARRRARG